MAEAELNVEELSVQELAVAAASVAKALEGNVHFPEPTPSPQELIRLIGELSAAEQTFAEYRRQTGVVRIARDAAAENLRQALAQEVAYVQEASGGEAAKILSASLHVEETTSFWPFSSVGTIEDLTASKGDRPGEIDLSWDAVAGASGYEVEIASDLIGERWEQSGATEKSKITLENLGAGSRCWFRVRAVGKRGSGDWCEPVMKYAR